MTISTTTPSRSSHVTTGLVRVGLGLSLLAYVLLSYDMFGSILIVSTMLSPVIFAVLLAHCLIMFFVMLKKGPVRRRFPRGLLIYWIVVYLLTLPFTYMFLAFGTGDIGSLMVTIEELRLGDAINIGIGAFRFEMTVAAIYTLASVVLTVIVVRRVPRGAGVEAVTLTSLLLMGPIAHFILNSLVPDRNHALIDPQAAIQPPVITARPETPRNLVLIYLESIERTYRDLDVTRSHFDSFARLEDAGVSFRDIGQVSGTEFTAGGILASQCGLPFVPRGIRSVTRKRGEAIGDENAPFVPAITCLGDILRDDGYSGTYINGSTLDIFAKGAIHRTHGYERVLGLKSYPDWKSDPRTNVWGMNDDLLFERIGQEIEAKVANGKPFFVTALTIATHGPDGFLDDTCAGGAVDGSLMPAAIACTGKHVEELLALLGRLGIADDTLVVLQSDHLTGKNTIFTHVLEGGVPRRNYVVALGKGQRQITRPGSMLDVYPTILELMGYELEDGRAGMGRSLIGEGQTLVEQHGVGGVNAAIRFNTDLQKAIWIDGARVDATPDG